MCFRDRMPWLGFPRKSLSSGMSMEISTDGMTKWANSIIQHYRIGRTMKCNSSRLPTNRSSSWRSRTKEIQSEICDTHWFFFFRYKSGLICICHVDLEGNHLNLLHKLSPESSATICCSIQFSHPESPLGKSSSLLWKKMKIFFQSAAPCSTSVTGMVASKSAITPMGKFSVRSCWSSNRKQAMRLISERRRITR